MKLPSRGLCRFCSLSSILFEDLLRWSLPLFAALLHAQL